jgi:hypothetical protein
LVSNLISKAGITLIIGMDWKHLFTTKALEYISDILKNAFIKENGTIVYVIQVELENIAAIRVKCFIYCDYTIRLLQ